MSTMRRLSSGGVGLVLCSSLLGALTGCVGYVDSRPHARVYAPHPAVYAEPARVYAPPPPVYVQPTVVVQEDYVYYPSYQVYYSGRSRQYVYLEGRSWVTRPEPPRVSASVLFASPSVRLDFHDSPSFHHTKIVQQYPKHWAPPGQSRGRKQGHYEEHDGNKKGNNGRD